MAKIELKAIGKDRRSHSFLKFTAGVSILNDGTVQILMPVDMARKLGFNK